MSLHRSVFLALVAALTLAAMASGVSSQDAEDSGSTTTVRAEMIGPDGVQIGTVTLSEGPHGVLVEVDVSGLSPGGHGFHIHAVGACEPDFTAAGGHFDPAGKGHGFEHALGYHAGDLPNIYAAADGSARADFFTAEVTLDVGPGHSLFDADGSAFIIHAKPDTYGEAAGAGDRVGCGVVRAVESAGGGVVADEVVDDADGVVAVEGPAREMPAG